MRLVVFVLLLFSAALALATGEVEGTSARRRLVDVKELQEVVKETGNDELLLDYIPEKGADLETYCRTLQNFRAELKKLARTGGIDVTDTKSLKLMNKTAKKLLKRRECAEIDLLVGDSVNVASPPPPPLEELSDEPVPPPPPLEELSDEPVPPPPPLEELSDEPVCNFGGGNPNGRKILSGQNGPERKYYIYTPSRYDDSRPSKVLLFFHGWQGDADEFTKDDRWTERADEYNYIIVAPQGLSDGVHASWTFPGSADGVGRNGGYTTCDTSDDEPDYCYPSCRQCPSRCGWTHCLDDDFEMVLELVQDLDRYICVDKSRIYAAGYSNGGMFSWSLAQDERTAPVLAGIATIMGLPHWDYDIGRAKAAYRDIPAIGIYGSNDCTVPPGDASLPYSKTCDGEGYYYVDAWKLHATWAQDHGCGVSGMPGSVEFSYNAFPNARRRSRILSHSILQCSTHCDPSVTFPASVDCRTNSGHQRNGWNLDVVFSFFDGHHTAGLS